MLECCNVGEPSVMTSTPGGGYPTQSPQSVASLLNTMNMDTSRQSAFVLSPPLAALHNMTEMKTPATSLLQNPSSYASQTSLKPHYSFSAATPHGISDILSRAANNFNNLVAGIPSARLNSAAAGMYLNSPVARPGFPKPLAELPGRSPIYWPGPMLQNPAWRPSAQSAMAMDKDGKKKHTRPTFSGHQIFALEKTFEQTKYLAGPERARLAYALGMSESQVKVWFQNRRTKWRKRHAAEMATAKKRQEERAEEIGENSDEDEEDFESMGCKDDDQKLDTTSPSMQTHPQQTMYNGLVNCGPNVTHAQ